MACEQAQRRGVDRMRRAIEVIAQQPPQAPNPLAIDRLGKRCLWIQPGDEGLAAQVVRDIAGGDANRAIGSVYCAYRNRQGQDQRAYDQLSQTRSLLLRMRPDVR